MQSEQDAVYEGLQKIRRGQYFNGKGKICSIDIDQEDIPTPILSSQKLLIDTYEYAVKVMIKNIKQPAEGSGYVSSFVDAAFNDNIFLWDTAFITMFTSFFGETIPGINALDNFYVKQYPDGEISRELVRKTGLDYKLWCNLYEQPLYSYFHNAYKYRSAAKHPVISYETTYKPELGREPTTRPYLTLDALNHPVLGFAEWNAFKKSGDLTRLREVFNTLYQYYFSFYNHLKHENNLYVTDWASMDNSPRNEYLGLAVDTSSQMVMSANILLSILDTDVDLSLTENEKNEMTSFLKDTSEKTKNAINRLLWDEKTGFYYDRTFSGELSPVKTVAAFWTILADVADENQLAALVNHLENPAEFNRLHLIPTVSADEPGYESLGGYWRGGVWAPICAMIVTALKHRGEDKLAKKIARNHCINVAKVFEKTGSIWEYYPPDEISAGENDHPDFVGWSGIGPVKFLIEDIIGIEANALKNKITWELDCEDSEFGCINFNFRDFKIDFLAEQTEKGIQIKINSPKQFVLELVYGGKSYVFDVLNKWSYYLEKSVK